MHTFTYTCACAFPLCLSVFQSVCLSVCLSICLSIRLSIYLSLCLSLSLSLFVCLSVCVSACLSVWMSACLSVSRRHALSPSLRRITDDPSSCSRKRANSSALRHRCVHENTNQYACVWVYILLNQITPSHTIVCVNVYTCI